MANTIQHKRGTAAEWTSANPTLAAGEFGFELDTGKIKLGDGSTAWSALGYFEAIAPTVYAITPVSSSVDEGNTLTFNVGGENITDGTYYWTIESNAGDFTATNGSFEISNNVGSFTVTPTADSTTEGDDLFAVSIRSDSITGTILQTSSSVTINDTSLTPPPSGQVAYTSSGTHSFVVPDGVTSISAVAVGGGAGGGAYNTNGGYTWGAGGGGELRYTNDIAVTPGETVTVVVGAAGPAGPYMYNPTVSSGGQSKLTVGGVDRVVANGGNPATGYSAGGSGGSGGIGTGGGNGGAGGRPGSVGPGGGGGAGGYSGSGGAGGSGFPPGSSSGAYAGSTGYGGGGGGGGGGAYNWDHSGNATAGGGGGGVGLLGQGASGGGGSLTSSTSTGANRGTGGSGGTGGSVTPAGGAYGGGGSRSTSGYYGNTGSSSAGAGGAVRIIWGENRAFPSTNTGNL